MKPTRSSLPQDRHMSSGVLEAHDKVVTKHPTYDGDLFSPEALRRPFSHYKTIRNLGPVVSLNCVDALALSRFDDVQAALRAPDLLISGNGVGFNEAFNTPNGPEPGVIQSDGAKHQTLRSHIIKPLMPGALKQYRELLKSMIVAQVRSLIGKGEFEAVGGVAKHLPLAAISFLVGLPEEGRQNMLRWAYAIFNMVGPYAPELDTDRATLKEWQSYLLSVDPSLLRKDSWAKTLFDAAAAGALTLGEARAALGAFIAPSLDTTINAKSSLLHNLSTNPEQWRLLKQNPSLVPSAVLEGVRHSATVRWFSRTVVSDYRHGDVCIPKGARVMLMYGSANRDERHYTDPDTFQVARNPRDQLGWGNGPHICGGMHLAKMEMEVLLEALVENVEHLEVGEPVLGINRGLYGFESLPMRMS